MAAKVNGNGNEENINRKEIQVAIAKAVELRALHAALMQGTNTNSPAHLRLLSVSSSPPPMFIPPPHFSAHDYPVFTPSYEDEPLAGYGHVQIPSETISECWDENRITDNNQVYDLDETIQLSSRMKGLINLDHHICPATDDTRSVTSSFLQTSPAAETLRSRRRNSLGDFKSVSSCNKCNPATISTDNNNDNRSSISKHSNMVVPLTDSHATINGNTASQNKSSRGTMMSWLLPRFKRRQKNESISSPIRTDSEDVSQVSVETLKKELIEANHKRELAQMEVSEMKSSFGELRKKLENLESYCEELKKALKQTVVAKKGETLMMPVSEEVMIEGFLQIVSEARLSVKQLCKTLVGQIEEESDDQLLMENLNQTLKPYKLSINTRNSKSVFYHLEAMINQEFFTEFENCVFQKHGTPKLLDPQQERRQQFECFVGLRNLSWNEVLKKGTKYYSEELSKFCDQKMRCIIVTLNWNRQWSEQLLQSFFVAAKCVWLLHLLAFSFNPPLMILRVDENRPFDAHYMEDMMSDKQKMQGPSRVKIMVMPGFYVRDKILRCKVLCRYKSSIA